MTICCNRSRRFARVTTGAVGQAERGQETARRFGTANGRDGSECDTVGKGRWQEARPEQDGISEEALWATRSCRLSIQRASREQSTSSCSKCLSEGVETRRSRRSAYIHRDRINGMLRARRGARLTAITNGGAIPDTADYDVIEFPE